MIDLTIRSNAQQVADSLHEASRRVSDIRPLLALVGEEVRASIVSNFDAQSDPMGRPWKPLKRPRRQRGRFSKARVMKKLLGMHLAAAGVPSAFGLGATKILIDTGRLRASIAKKVEGNSRVLIGTNVVYAAAQNFGYQPRNLPARTFLGIRRGDERVIEKTIEAWVADRIGKGNG
jgi:phage gpG-like protein